MRIAVVGTRGVPAQYSGFETNVEEVGCRLAARGHEVTVFCRARKSTTNDAIYRGLRRVVLPSLKNKYLDTLSHTALSVARLKSVAPDVIHLYGVGNAMFLPGIRAAGYRVVTSVDGLDWERGKWNGFARGCLKASARAVVSLSHRYVVDSQITSDYYAAHFRRIPECIPYGAVTDRPSTRQSLTDLGLEARGYVLFVGRLVPEKRVDTLVRAFVQTGVQQRLVIVGDNPYDRDYVAWLKSLADERVLFPGYMYGQSYAELTANCTAYVQPSELEGTSPALLGAMGMSACVIVSDIPENRETVGDAGVTFRCGDADDLSAKLETIIRDPALAEDRRRAALDRVSVHYNWDTIADRWDELFSSVARS